MTRFFQKLRKNCVEGKLIEVTIQPILNFFSSVRMFFDLILSILPRIILSRKTEIAENKIIFMTYNNDYMCNPKYICEELLRQQLPLDIVWATTAKKLTSNQFPAGIRLVVRGTEDFFNEVASAKVWVDNAFCFTWNPIPKKKEQFYLQTWHGSMGLKRIGKNDVKSIRWIFSAWLGGKWTDICISNSKFETEVFRQTHWPKTQIAEYGHARNDLLFANNEIKKEFTSQVREYFEIPPEKKIALYGPTFRDKSDVGKYSLDYTKLLDSLEKKFGGEWVLLNRFHFKTKIKRDVSDKRVLSATSYPDMQELMLAADVGITDYSSWICDYVLTGKPAFIYAPDIKEYDQERGFYYPLKDTPFLIAENNTEMIENIFSFESAKYSDKCERFLRERGCKENGTAAKTIVNVIKTQMNLNVKDGM